MPSIPAPRTILMCSFLIAGASGASARSGEHASWHHSHSITVAPLDLLVPVIRVQAEFRLAMSHGVSALAAIGPGGNHTAGGIGMQYAWYPIGDFERGMLLGAMFHYSTASATYGDVARWEPFSPASMGIGIAPVIGYKYSVRSGFTIHLTGGVGPMIFRTHVPPSSSSSTSRMVVEEKETWTFVHLMLGLGWSF